MNAVMPAARNTIRRLWRLLRTGKRYHELYGFRALVRAGEDRLARKVVRPVVRRGARSLFRARSLFSGSAPIRVRVEDVSLSLLPRGAVAFGFWSGEYFEGAELGLVVRMLRRGAVFLDVGANSGLFAVAAGQKLEQLGGGQVYACEPCSWTFVTLQENIRLNGLSNVSAHRLALADHEGQATLQVNVPGKDGLNTLGHPSHPDSQVVTSEIVPLTTLDAFVQARQISQIDLMKVDVEGAELLVFSGARDLLSRQDAPIVLYESFGYCTAGFNYHPVEIIWLLQDLGYQIFVLTSKGQVVLRQPEHGYEGTMVAAKPSHPLFQGLPGSTGQ